MLNKKNFDFSFSGLKTAVLYETKKHPELLKNPAYITEVSHEFQQAVVDVLLTKTIRAAKEYDVVTIMLAGGVSANQELRKQLGEAIASQLPAVYYCLPEISLTGDNAAMIATAAALHWNKINVREKQAAFNNWKTIQANANLKLI